MKRLEIDIHNPQVPHMRRIISALCFGYLVPGISTRFAALAVLVLSFAIAPTRADVPVELGDNIRIEAPTATPDLVGGTSLIQFRIVNESTTSLVLLGISTPVASRAKLLATLATDKKTVLESISIPPSETLDLTTFHLKYEISPLNRTLESGNEFPITLNFVVGRSPSPFMSIRCIAMRLSMSVSAMKANSGEAADIAPAPLAGYALSQRIGEKRHGDADEAWRGI